MLTRPETTAEPQGAEPRWPAVAVLAVGGLTQHCPMSDHGGRVVLSR
jgi:hypothetical protein